MDAGVQIVSIIGFVLFGIAVAVAVKVLFLGGDRRRPREDGSLQEHQFFGRSHMGGPRT